MFARPTTAVAIAPALATLFFVIALSVLIGPFLAAIGVAGIGIMQVVGIGIPAVLVARAPGPGTLARLGLTVPKPRVMIGAGLLGVTFWYINLVVIVPASVALLGGEKDVELLEKLYEGIPLWGRLLALGLAPALCEELLFRGVLARSLARRLGLGAAIAISATLFGVIHAPLPRIIPAAATGAILAFVALSSDSLLPAMVVHLLNNVIALSMTSTSLAPSVDWITAHGALALVGALVLSALGAVLVAAPAPRSLE